MKRKSITEQQWQIALASLRNGESLHTAAAKAGCTHSPLCRRINAYGGRLALNIPLPLDAGYLGNGSDATPGMAVVAQKLAAGAFLPTVAKWRGIRSDTVMKSVPIMMDAGLLPADFVLFDPVDRYDDRHDDAIRCMIGEGADTSDIAAELMIPTRFVDFRRRRLEVSNCPRGWLMTEAQVAALFASARVSGGRVSA